MMTRWWLVEQQQIFTNITNWLMDLLTYQGTFRNTYGVNKVYSLISCSTSKVILDSNNKVVSQNSSFYYVSSNVQTSLRSVSWNLKLFCDKIELLSVYGLLPVVLTCAQCCAYQQTIFISAILQTCLMTVGVSANERIIVKLSVTL